MMQEAERSPRRQRFQRRCFVRVRQWRLAASTAIVTVVAADASIPLLHPTAPPAAVAAVQAARILTIAPNCAGPGDEVLITGQGFGAENVRIFVDTLPAVVLNVYGNRVTFIVPAGVSGGVTTVCDTQPGQHQGCITFRVQNAEVCSNQIDEDCDGEVDDADVCAPVNHSPVANAGPDRTAIMGATVQLTGIGSSDPDGNALSFQWTILSRPDMSSATLQDALTPMPTLTLDAAGSYTVQLTVSDGSLTASDTVVVSTENSAPVADAGPDQSGRVGDSLTLDGSHSSDIDGDALTYQWSLVSHPAGSTATLANPTSVMPQLTLDVFGDYAVQLIVNDGATPSQPDTVALSTINSPPVANAGADQSHRVSTLVMLDGGDSHDVDGHALTYQWSFVSRPAGSMATLSAPTSVMPTFTIDLPGQYVAQLVVNDGLADSQPDTVVISTANSPPVANAGADQSHPVHTLVTLDGSGSHDVDGDALTYRWSLTTQPPGSATTLSDSTSVTPAFTIDLPGTYVAQLIVHDGSGSSDPDTVTISTVNSPPVAAAGADQSHPVNTLVTLDGGGSHDADGDSLTYQWALIALPTGSAATLTNSQSVTPTFTPDLPGEYMAQLIVNDGTVDSQPDTILIVATEPDSTPSPAPDMGKITASPVTSGQTTVTGTASSVEGGGSVTLTNTRTQESSTVTANPDGSFMAVVGAQWEDWLVLVVSNAQGGTSAGRLLALEAPLQVVVMEPAPDAFIPATTVRVRGVVQGPRNNGVTVNGRTALLTNGEFVADAVPLVVGANVVTVTATTHAGQSVSQTLTVQSGGVPPVLEVTAAPRSGSAPLPVTFTYAWYGSTAIQSLGMDFDGDGAVDLTTTDPQAVLTYVYPTPGVYLARLDLTDAQGSLSTADTVVVVTDAAVMDAIFTQLWQGMNVALSVGDAANALTFLTTGARENYAPVFTVLLPHMPEIIASYSPLQRVSLSGEIGEYAIMRVLEGQLRLFLVYFLQDAYGVWRVDAM